jgi:hypothetical protein
MVCFRSIAEAEWHPTANVDTCFGEETGAGRKGADIVGGQGEDSETAGGYSPVDNVVSKPARARLFRQRVLPSPGSAGADRAGNGGERRIVQPWQGNTFQRTQLVYLAVDNVRVNVVNAFSQLRFYLFNEQIPHTVFLHYPPPHSNSPFW